MVVDGTDNFATRYLVNDACVLLGKPNVYGSIFRFEGQATIFCTDEAPATAASTPSRRRPGWCPPAPRAGCWACSPAWSALIQATEAVKSIIGTGEPLVGRLLLVDALGMHFRTVKLRKDPRCPACGTRELKALIDYQQFCGIRGQEEETDGVPSISRGRPGPRRRRGDDLDLVDVREPHEWEICRIEGARLAPLSAFAESLRTLDSARDVVVYCKSGRGAPRWFASSRPPASGRVWNLAGGIPRWSEEVDPTVPRY